MKKSSPAHLRFFFDLNRAHARAVRRFDASLGGVHGIGLNDLHLLHTLEAAPGHRLRRTDLAQTLGLTASGVTWLLRPLIKRRLVTNEPSADDGRVTFAVLTAAGRRLVEDAVPSAHEIASDLLEAHERDDVTRAADMIARLG